MFKLLYIYLYRYTSIFNNSNIYLVAENNINLGSVYSHFNISNIDHSCTYKFKKKHILFLKKKLFFFRFLNKPLSLYKKIIRHGNSILNIINGSTKSTNSIRSRLIRGCFKKIGGKRPSRNLYYKISRSRPLIRGAFPQIKSSRCLSSFIKNSENLTINNCPDLHKYTPDIVLQFKNPLLLEFSGCVDNTEGKLSTFSYALNKIRVDGLLSRTKYRSKRYSSRLLTSSKLNTIDKVKSKRKFRFGIVKNKYKRLPIKPKKVLFRHKFSRNIPFFWYLFRANVFNRLINFFKVKRIFLTYFFWYKMTSLISRVQKLIIGNRITLFKSRSKVILNSNLTGLDIVRTKNNYKLNYIECSSLGASVVSIYNIKTYNWLVTI